MKSCKRSFAVVAALFAVLLSLPSLVVSAGTLYARDLAATLTLAAAQPAKQQCMNICRGRYHACFSLKQIPSSECRGVYQDCISYSCTGLGPG
jgi:hypothetical protein